MIGALQCFLSAREMGQYTETKWHGWQPALSWKTGRQRMKSRTSLPLGQTDVDTDRNPHKEPGLLGHRPLFGFISEDPYSKVRPHSYTPRLAQSPSHDKHHLWMSWSQDKCWEQNVNVYATFTIRKLLFHFSCTINANAFFFFKMKNMLSISCVCISE